MTDLKKTITGVEDSFKNKTKVKNNSIRRFWTNDEINFLKEKSKNLTHKELSKILERSLSSIKRKSQKMGIRKKKVWNKEELKQEIIKRSKELGRTLRNIDYPDFAGICSYHFGSWNNALIYSGFKINQERESTLKENYNLMTPSKSYLLGCVYGDACVSGNSISIGVVDKEFAEEFAKSFYEVYGLKMTLKLRRVQDRIKNGKNYKCKPQWSAFITAKRASEDLMSYGGTDTFNWEVPKEILESNNTKIISMFLKGFVDSEGCVYLGKRGCSITIASSNVNGLKQIVFLFSKINIKSRLIENSINKCVSITHYSNQKSFLENVGLTIKRKKDKLQNYLMKHSTINNKKIKLYNKVMALHKSNELKPFSFVREQKEKNDPIDVGTVYNWINKEIKPSCMIQ